MLYRNKIKDEIWAIDSVVVYWEFFFSNTLLVGCETIKINYDIYYSVVHKMAKEQTWQFYFILIFFFLENVSLDLEE